MRLAHMLMLLKETARRWHHDDCLRLGAALSYYTFFSLFPLLLVVLSVLRLVLANSDVAQTAILDALERVTGSFRSDFETALAALGRTRATSGALGMAILVVGACWVFGDLVSALNIIWGVEAPWRGGSPPSCRR